MKTLIVLLIAVCSAFGASVPHGTADTWFEGESDSFTLEFVTIDDPGNPAKTGTGNNWDPGSVPYTFKIMKTEIPWSAGRKWLQRASIFTTMRSGVTGVADTENRPLVRPIYRDALQLVNYINLSKGYPAAYRLTEDGHMLAWPASKALVRGGLTNYFRRSGARYFLPTLDEVVKAAQWDKSAQTWMNYGVGGTDTPNRVCGFFGGSGLDGCEVVGQVLDPRFPEYKYGTASGNTFAVTLTTSGGGITGVTLGSYLSGYAVTNDTTTACVITQGSAANGRIRVSAYTTNQVPAQFEIVSGGSGYNGGFATITNGVGTVTLSGNSITCTVYTIAGAVVGITPTAGTWATVDTNTVVSVVQGGNTNATARCIRYAGVVCASTLGTITAAGSGYSNGAAVLATVNMANVWQSAPRDTNQPWQGAAPVDEAGGLSPFGVRGLNGNVHEYALQGWSTGTLSDVSEMMGFYSAFWNLSVPIAHGLWFQDTERKAVWENSIFYGTNEGGLRLVEVE